MVWYEAWELPGIEIVTREERWADETWRHADSGWFDRFKQNNEAYQNRLDGDVMDPYGTFAARHTREITKQKQRSYMINNFPDEYVADETVEEENGEELWWPISLKEERTKIMIHHTATDGQHASQQEVIDSLQYIYKLHTHQNGRWDIWYNFLIDRFGNIYEWRAGGPWAVGAHASWNNVKAIWIAMFGNFNNEEPSQEMMNSLIKLTTMLALKYDIEPHQEQYYFTELNEEPYMEVHQHESIAWHKDVKNTACPGTNMYAKLPEIKDKVQQYLSLFEAQWISSLDDIVVEKITTPVYIQWDDTRLTFALDVSRDSICTTLDEQVLVAWCRQSGDYLLVDVAYGWYPASGLFTLLVEQQWKSLMIDVPLIRQKDLDRFLTDKKNQYLVAHGLPSVQQTSEKVKDLIEEDEVIEIMNDDVRVLLYELTADFDRWDMTCEGRCDVTLDTVTSIEDARIIHVVENNENDWLDVFIDLQKYSANEVRISNPWWLIEVGNYLRKANGIPYNIFRGDIRILKDEYRHLDYWWIERYVVVNELPLQNYMEWIAEASESQHPEKNKTLAMLVKNYALYYIKWTNPHPSIPSDGSYNAVDDPRIFQKYVWAGFESYGKNWLEAVRATKDLVIFYDDYLPILPYFHCSAGFTRSWRERRWRTDTPWLKSKLDFETCDGWVFAWHGVWLSGNGAQNLALKWATFEEILKWYYDGIEIREMNN